MIVGPLREGTEPRPKQISSERLDGVELRNSSTGMLGARKIVFQRIRPSEALRKRQQNQLRTHTVRSRPAPMRKKIVADVSEQGMAPFFVSAAVVDRRASLIEWSYEGQRYAAWSNLNFNHLRGFSGCRKGSLEIAPILAVSNVSSGRRYQIPRALPLGKPVFLMIQGDEREDLALAPMRLLHELYENEGPRLRAAYESRLRSEPLEDPAEGDLVIFHWRSTGDGGGE